MNRVLVIDQDSTTTTRTLGLACLQRGIGVAFADNVCEGVRVLLVVAVRPETPLDSRVALELAGFRVLTKPVTVEELVEKAPGV